MKRSQLIIIFSLACSSLLLAGTNGSLEGFVYDKTTNQPLIGASVQILGTQLGAASDVNGFYLISNIPAGAYDIRCSFVGYHQVIIKQVLIKADLKTKLDIQLISSQVELYEVEIVAERPPIQKDVTGTMHRATEKSFEVMPVSNVSEIIALQPGVTMENNIRGGKTTEVVYLVDGLPIQNLIEGGSGGDLPQSSIGELTVQTGGFDPEYGNALSGIINVVTKRGGEKSVIALRAEKDDLFGGKQVDHRNELDFSASGPIMSDLFYFASINAIYTDTRWWQDLKNFYSSPIAKSFSGFGKADYYPMQALRITGQLYYSYSKWHDYEYSWRFNLSGLPPRAQEGWRAALIVSHTLSNSFFYTASISRYNLNTTIGEGGKNNVDTTLYQWDFYLQYILGGDRSWWAEKRQINTLGKIDFTWRLTEQHMLKFGGELNLQEIYSDVFRYEPYVNVFGKPFINKPLLNYSTDYQYYPRSGSAYLQDKIELSKDGMLLNLGMRYDFLDPRARRPVAERVLTQENEYQTQITKTVPASVKHLFSPRIGFAAPFATSGYLFINYGKYYQFPLFDYLYSGLNNVSLKKGVGALVGNPDLNPEVTRAWEMSIKYALKNNLVLSTTYFHKETENQVDVKTFIPTNARVAGDYGFAEFVNNPYATANGIEVSISKDEGKPLNGSLSYTYMIAEGVSQDAREGIQYYQWGIPVPATPFPLSWDQRHTVKMAANISLPYGIDASILWSFNTGRPYTYYPSSDGFTPKDSTQEFQPNNARMKSFNMVDMKLSRNFSDILGIRLILYCDGRNMLNTQNVKWMDASGLVGGELGDVTAYYPYRRVRIGIRVEI